MKKIVLLNLFVLAASSLFANPFTCTIKNINQPKNTNNVIEFDVYVQNTGKQTLKFQSLQAGINFNYEALANGGVITGQFVKNSADRSLPSNQQNPNWVISPETKQIRLLAAIQTSPALATTIPAQGLKLGTYRLTNTHAFASVKPNFEWSFVTANGKTKSAFLAYVDNKTSGQSLTTQKTFSFENQGPEYFVESNPTINKPADQTTVTAAVTNNDIKVYPNPVTEFVKVDFTANQTENVVLKVIDNNGRLVKQIQEEVSTGTTTLSIEMKDLANGTYVLQVYQSGKSVLNKQIVKQ
jgi:hypothetical protein